MLPVPGYLKLRLAKQQRGRALRGNGALSAAGAALAAVALVGTALTLLVPSRRTHDLHSTPIEPSVTAVESVSQPGRANPTT